MNMTSGLRMNITRASKLENIPYEEQVKFVNDRLLSTEDKLAKICTAFSQYIMNISSLRNGTDNLASILHEFASEEKINTSLRSQVLQFSDLLLSLGDSRDDEVKQMDEKIVRELSGYHTLCREAKTKIKSILSLKEKEMIKQKQLQKLRNRNPYNREQIIKAEASLSVAVGSISKSLKELEEHLNNFERKKIDDLKSLLKNFVIIEMTLHSRAIQILTKSFNIINDIDTLGDLHDFKISINNNILEENKEKIKKEVYAVNESSPTLSFDIEESSQNFGLKDEVKQPPLSSEDSKSENDISISDSYTESEIAENSDV